MDQPDVTEPRDEPDTKVPWWTLYGEDLAGAIRKLDPPLVAVVDTNAMLDVTSCHDLIEDYLEIQGNAPDDGSALLHLILNGRLAYRAARARSALRLAIHFHEVKARTLGLRGEYFQILGKNVPRDDSTPFQRAFTTTHAHFVRDKLLPGWDHVFAEEDDEPMRGAVADASLVRFAKAGGLPVITGEGWTTKGQSRPRHTSKQMPALCERDGVPCSNTGDFSSQLLSAGARHAFLTRFRDLAPEYVRTYEHPSAAHAAALNLIYNLYALLLEPVAFHEWQFIKIV